MHCCCGFDFSFIQVHIHSQESTCKKGKRRRVARRALNALGGISGICGFVNDDNSLREMKLNMKFADSLESIKSAERSFKAVKANRKRKAHYDKAKEKLNLADYDKFYKSHASKLTIEQMKVGLQVNVSCR
jgi:triacylglycerol esterase/lipase EstA (alpha/beta hydrolase family)